MASIQSLGVGSGLLTSELVEDIIAAERQATDLRLDARRAEFEARISSFGALRSRLDSLRSAISPLSTSDGLNPATATSTDPTTVSASVTSAAVPGVHTVEVSSLARAHGLSSVRFDAVDDVVGDGTLDIRFGTTTFSGADYDTFTENESRAAVSIEIDSESNTLAGIRDTINEADLGVTAQIVNDGQGFVLMLSSDQTGEAHSLEISVTEGTTAGLSALAFNAGAAVAGTNLTQTVAADDASLTVDGIAITRETNTVDEVIEGVTFSVGGLNPGTPALINVTRDTSAVRDSLEQFVTTFNELKALADELTAFDPDEGTGALLLGDALVRNVQTQLRRVLTASVTNADLTLPSSLVDIGIRSDQFQGFSLVFDSAKFDSAFSTNPDAVSALLSESTSASDSFVKFISQQAGTRPGDYAVVVDVMASEGSVEGASVAGLAGTTVIDASNDSLSVSIDGTSSGEILLTPGSYTGAALAAEIALQINADDALQTAGAEVEVSFDASSNLLTINSTSIGADSIVAIDAVDTNSLADFGLTVDDGEAGRGTDVAGTINGVTANGNGQFLSLPYGPQAATSGFVTGSAISGFDSPPLVIDGDNSSFGVAVDGVTSGAISLTEQSYSSGAELATEIESQINADVTLNSTGAEVDVTFNTANSSFTVSSRATGASSSVQFTSLSTNFEADLGLSVAAGTKGKNATSKVDDAAGLQVQILGGGTGPRGTVTLTAGVMQQLDEFLDSALNFDGSINNKLGILENQIDDLDAEASQFDTRMSAVEARLRAQFATADALISTLNNTGSFLDQQLKALPTIGGNDS